MRAKLPKRANLMDGAEEDVLAYMTFPQQHRAKLHSTKAFAVTVISPDMPTITGSVYLTACP